MAGFQKTVLVIAIILLILILVIIGYSLSYSAKANWPPIVGDCPDYWVDLSGNGTGCYNSRNLGTCSPAVEDDLFIVDFSGYDNCQKYTWATNCKITWDGITSGVLNPCVDTTTTTTEE